jgi:hypothetical protein
MALLGRRMVTALQQSIFICIESVDTEQTIHAEKSAFSCSAWRLERLLLSCEFMSACRRICAYLVAF